MSEPTLPVKHNCKNAFAPDVGDGDDLCIIFTELGEVRVHALKDDVEIREARKIGGLAQVVEWHDVGVMQVREDAHLPKDALGVFKDVKHGVDLLDRDALACKVVLCLDDRPVGSFAQRALDLKAQVVNFPARKLRGVEGERRILE